MAEPAYEMTTYAELADLLDTLPLLVREARRSRRLTMRQAAAQIGVSASTVLRLEAGDGGDRSAAVLFLRWLDVPGQSEPSTNQEPTTEVQP